MPGTEFQNLGATAGSRFSPSEVEERLRGTSPVKLEPTDVGCYEVEEGLRGAGPVKLEPTDVGCYEVEERLHGAGPFGQFRPARHHRSGSSLCRGD